MKKAFVSVLCLSLLLLSVPAAYAADTAKSLGMAGAVVAIADDLSAPFINPAGLINIKKQVVGLSANSSKMIWWDPMDGVKGDDSDMWENVGYITPLGPGVLFVGSGLTRSFFLDGLDDGSLGGASYDYTFKVYAPSVSYAMRIMPTFSIGATASYFMANDFWDIDLTGIKRSSSGTGMGMLLGLMYSPMPLVDLGASLNINSNITTYGKYESDPFSIAFQENFINPSELKLGASARPMQGLTVGLEFDIKDRICGYFTTQAPDAWADWMELHADSVMVSRLGAEYQVQAPGGYIPVWAGIYTIPDPSARLEFVGSQPMALSIGAFQYLGADMTGMSIGTGYVADMFSVGLAVSSSRGIVKEGMGLERFIVENNKVVASGSIMY